MKKFKDDIIVYLMTLAMILLPPLALMGFRPSKAGWVLLLILFIVATAKFSDRNSSDSNHSFTPTPPQDDYPSHSESTIRTHTDNLIARMVTDGNRTAIYDHAGNYHGYYNSDTDCTYDHAGNIVARGNVLATLVHSPY